MEYFVIILTVLLFITIGVAVHLYHKLLIEKFKHDLNKKESDI